MNTANFKCKLTLKKEGIVSHNAMEMQNLKGGAVTQPAKDLKKFSFSIGCSTIISNGGLRNGFNC